MGAYFAWLGGARRPRVPSALARRLAFLLLSHAVGGVIHVQICLSHFSRDDLRRAARSTRKWVEMQLRWHDGHRLPALAWTGSTAGLQFQTEHHLVPRMPRHKLRRFREEALRPCLKAHGLTMHDQPIVLGGQQRRCGARSRNVRERRRSSRPAFVHAVNLEG